MKVIVGSVIYTEALEYLEDFLASIEAQTDNEFEVLLINDNISSEIAESILIRHPLLKSKIVLIETGGGKKPFQLRVRLLKEAKKRGAELLILADCDDKLSPARVQCTKTAFMAGYAFYYNEIRLFDGRYVMPELPAETHNIEQVTEYNYLGLSNTALNLSIISDDFIDSLLDGDTSIFDWYMYSRVLLEGGKGLKVNNCFTYYRIHANNLAGKIEIDTQSIRKEIDIKLMHYKLLMKYENNRFSELYDLYMHYKERGDFCVSDNALYFWWGLIDSR